MLITDPPGIDPTQLRERMEGRVSAPGVAGALGQSETETRPFSATSIDAAASLEMPAKSVRGAGTKRHAR